MSIGPFLKSQAFGPEMTKAMGIAFDAACKQVGAGTQSKETLAKRIIEAARSGERNPQRLCAKTLDIAESKQRHG